MTLLDCAQIGISTFGVAAFLLVLGHDKKKQKIGAYIGLFSGVFWYTMMVLTSTWLMLPVHLLYTYGWSRKLFELRKIKLRRSH